MHARDRSISGEHAAQRAVSFLGSLKRNRAGGRRGCHVLDAKRPTMQTSHAGIEFSAGAEGECSAARRSPFGELPSPCMRCRKTPTRCPGPAPCGTRHVLTARGRQVRRAAAPRETRHSGGQQQLASSSSGAQRPAPSAQRPAVSSQQPAASAQRPAPSSQQPAATPLRPSVLVQVTPSALWA